MTPFNIMSPSAAPIRVPIRMSAHRPGLRQIAPIAPRNLELEKLALLRSAAAKILTAGASVANALNTTYAQYAHIVTPSFLDTVVSQVGGVTARSVYEFISGSPNRQALVKLEAARMVGNAWLLGVKNEWFTENQETNLHEELRKADPNLEAQVEARFDEVNEAARRVQTLQGNVQRLPETMISEGVRLFLGDVWKASDSMVADVGKIGQGIRDLIKAISEITKKGGGAAEEFSQLPAIIVVGGLLALVIALR